MGLFNVPLVQLDGGALDSGTVRKGLNVNGAGSSHKKTSTESKTETPPTKERSAARKREGDIT
jgi:hypothetical protein